MPMFKGVPSPGPTFMKMLFSTNRPERAPATPIVACAALLAATVAQAAQPASMPAYAGAAAPERAVRPGMADPTRSTNGQAPLMLDAGKGHDVATERKRRVRLRRRSGRRGRARSLAARGVRARQENRHDDALCARHEQQAAGAAHRRRHARHDHVARHARRAIPEHECPGAHGTRFAAALGPGGDAGRRGRHRAGGDALSRRQGSAHQPHDDRLSAAGAVARAHH